MGDDRWLSEGEEAPRSGQFHYVDRWHDPYQKRILGREFPPSRVPMQDGEEVLDMLADDPPAALVEGMAAAFLAHRGASDQIARVQRVLVLSPEFEAPVTKIRRPVEFMAGLCRAVEAEIDAPDLAWSWELPRAGWRQHEHGPPTGHPDRIDAWTWASAVNRRVDPALNVLHPDAGGVRFDLAGPKDTRETAGAFLERHAAAVSPGAAAGIAAELVTAFGLDPDSAAADHAPELRAEAAAIAIAFAAMRPDFLLWQA